MSHLASPENESDPVDLTGRSLGDFEMIRRLGRGGMADVYLAIQKSLGRQVAVKVLKPELSKDSTYLKRFHREAKAAASLSHANIVQIHEVGENDGFHFIVQEYIRGQNLKQYLQRHTVAEPVLALNIIRQVAGALQDSHQRDVIHRDIKPENIMLTPEGDVKVTDFGLARVQTDNKSDLTQIGITMGTPLYMSPEQVEGRATDGRSDIYSLGVTAFHMLVGRPPFEAENPLALAVQHVKKKPPPLDKLRPDLPAQFCSLVEKMIAKDPADRFRNPAELLKSIRGIELGNETDWQSLAQRLQVERGSVSLSDTDSLEVTRQLESVFSDTGKKRWLSMSSLLIGLLLVALGGITGVVLAGRNLEAPDDTSVTVAQGNEIVTQASAEEQYIYAYFLTARQSDSERPVSFERAEQVWQEVRTRFPPEESETPAELLARNLWCRRADERLGELYLQYNKWDKAYEVYQRLANVEKTEKRFRTVGLAGQAVVFSNQGNDELALQLLYLIESDRSLLNNFMSGEVNYLNEFYFTEED